MLITVELITEAATIQVTLIFLGIRSVKNNVRKVKLLQRTFMLKLWGKNISPFVSGGVRN